MKKYRHFDTGELWTEEELKHDYELYAEEIPCDSFEDYLEEMLRQGREKTGGLEEVYEYGMRLRGFSIGCQPMRGFVERMDDPSGKYYDILVYDRELTDEEVSNYELDEIQEV